MASSRRKLTCAKEWLDGSIISISSVMNDFYTLKHHLLNVAAKSWIKTLKQTIQYKKTHKWPMLIIVTLGDISAGELVAYTS